MVGFFVAMYYVYILYSEKLDRNYVGTTDDVTKRLVEHNNGIYQEAFTTKGIPWISKWKYKCVSSAHAYAFEAFIKRMKSSDFINRLVNDPQMAESISNKLLA
jgi:putative endonuclease